MHLVATNPHATNRTLLRSQASLCEGESKEKFLAAKLELEAKAATQRDAQERLNIAREALNDKHRELLKTTRNDPIKVLLSTLTCIWR